MHLQRCAAQPFFRGLHGVRNVDTAIDLVEYEQDAATSFRGVASRFVISFSKGELQQK